MHPFPHHYSVVAKADAQGDVALESQRLPTIPSAPPTEFGGPGNRWSPETLFVAAVADCFVLTFRGISRGDAVFVGVAGLQRDRNCRPR